MGPCWSINRLGNFRSNYNIEHRDNIASFMKKGEVFMGVNLQVLHVRALWTNYRHINLEGARLGSHERWWKVRLHDAETLPDLLNLWDLRKRTWLHSASLALLWEKEFLTLQAGETNYGLHAASSCTWSYTGIFLPESFRELGDRLCVLLVFLL